MDHEIKYPPEQPVVDDPLDFLETGVKSLLVADGQHDLSAFSRLQDRVAFGTSNRHGLLEQHVNSPVCRFDRKACVRIRRRRDHHGVQPLAMEHFIKIAVGSGCAPIVPRPDRPAPNRGHRWPPAARRVLPDPRQMPDPRSAAATCDSDVDHYEYYASKNGSTLPRTSVRRKSRP